MTVTANIESTAEWFAGEDKVLTFTVVDDLGATQNITGWALEWVLRTNRYHPTAVLTKTTGSGITIDADQVGAGKGKFYVQVDHADTTSLKAGTYAHAAARTDTNNFDVISEGTAVLLKASAR